MRQVLTVLVTLLIALGNALADVPGTISFQGLLTDASGNPVPDDNYSVTFAIYNAATGGLILWSEVQTVSTADGIFSAVLGATSVVPDSALTDTAAYLEITVETGTPITPRTQLTSAPYSFVSRSLQGQGPVQLELTDPSSGENGEVSIDIEKSDRVKVKFHWDVENPSSGDSASHDMIITADSSVTTQSHHEPIRIMKRIDKASPLLSETRLFTLGLANDSASWIRRLDAIDGFLETTTTETSSNVATGKRQHKPFSITKSSSLSNATDLLDWKFSLQADSGYSETVGMTKADLIAEIAQGVNQTREHILLARQVGIPGSTTSSSLELETSNEGPQFVMTREGTAADPEDDGVVILDASVPGGTSLILQSMSPTLGTNGVETRTSNGRSTVRPYDLSLSGDSSFINIAVDDTIEAITFTKTTGPSRFESIVLKRGSAGGGEFALSHIGAGVNDGVFISSDAAAGGQIGINTSSPTLPFHLVGSGCYTGTFGVCSDERYKENINPLHDPLATVQALRGVEYSWRRDAYPDHQFPAGNQLGLIAQEVEPVLPSVVQTDAQGYKSVDYARLTPLLIEAIKEQQRQIDSQQDQIKELKDLVQRLVNHGAQDSVVKLGSR